MPYKIVGYCKDCTGIDTMGCNEGEPFDLGFKDTMAEAIIVADMHSESCSPYYAEVFNENGEKLLYETNL